MVDPYQFIPAAIYAPYHGSIGVYVRYHKHKNIPITQKAYTPQYVWLDTPDRELLMVCDSNYSVNCRPLDCNFDEFHSFSPIHPTSNSLNFPWVMFNYLQSSDANVSLNFTEFYSQTKKNWSSICDSGGFQLGSGGINFIDPESLAKWYKKNVDVGITLDVPPRSVKDDDLRYRSAKVQANNNKVILDILKGSSTQMMNISHGKTISQQLKYHDVVFSTKSDKLAVGGLMGTKLSNLLTFCQVVYHPEFNQHYKHYHYLGSFNSKIIPSLVWLAKLQNDKNKTLVTSDASTAIQLALQKGYQFLPMQSEALRNLDFQSNKKKPILSMRSTERRLPCNCPVCSVIKYVDVFNQFNGNIHMLFMTMHNLFVMQSHSKFLNDLARNLSFEEYYDAIRHQQKSFRAPETLLGLSFLNMVEHRGMKDAVKHYKIHLPASNNQINTEGLFGVIESTDTKKTKNLESTIKGYERYHKTEKKPTVQRTTLK